MIGNAIKVARIATGEEVEALTDDGKDKAAVSLGKAVTWALPWTVISLPDMRLGSGVGMRTFIICSAVFLLAGLSLLTSHLIVEYVPDASPPSPQVVAQAAVSAPVEQGTGKTTVLIVLGLIVVISIQLWWKER